MPSRPKSGVDEDGDDIAPSPPADPPRGIRCRKCHCADLRVVQTIRDQGDKIYRRRVCRHCGTAQMTTESSNGKNGASP